MALDKFIASVRSEVAKRFDLKSDAEIDAFFIGMEESAKDNQEALEKRDKLLRDAVAELCEAKRLLKMAVDDINSFVDCLGVNCDECCCDRDTRCHWKHEAEALKLFGGGGDIGGITIQEKKV